MRVLVPLLVWGLPGVSLAVEGEGVAEAGTRLMGKVQRQDKLSGEAEGLFRVRPRILHCPDDRC
jgi:hypothetical protein